MQKTDLWRTHKENHKRRKTLLFCSSSLLLCVQYFLQERLESSVS